MSIRTLLSKAALLAAFTGTTLSAATTLTFTGNGTASGNTTITANTTATDREWNLLADLYNNKRNVPAIISGPVKNPAQVLELRRTIVVKARQVSDAARDFRSRYPAHPRAPFAFKIEAISALEGVDDDDRRQEESALQVAAEYRRNLRNHPRDRFEVAELAERVGTRKARGGRAEGKNVSEDEKIAGKLRAEFGDMPEVWRQYAAVARVADMGTATRIANQIVLSTAGPETKAEASAILTRNLLIGRRLDAQLTELDAKSPLDLKKSSEGPTVLYLWSHRSPGSISGLGQFKNSLPKNLRVLYYSPGATTEELRALKQKPAIAGSLCLLPKDATARFVEQLRIQQVPCVFVLNSAGTVVGWGPVGETRALLALAK